MPRPPEEIDRIANELLVLLATHADTVFQGKEEFIAWPLVEQRSDRPPRSWVLSFQPLSTEGE